MKNSNLKNLESKGVKIIIHGQNHPFNINGLHFLIYIFRGGIFFFTDKYCNIGHDIYNHTVAKIRNLKV